MRYVKAIRVNENFADVLMEAFKNRTVSINGASPGWQTVRVSDEFLVLSDFVFDNGRSTREHLFIPYCSIISIAVIEQNVRISCAFSEGGFIHGDVNCNAGFH